MMSGPGTCSSRARWAKGGRKRAASVCGSAVGVRQAEREDPLGVGWQLAARRPAGDGIGDPVELVEKPRDRVARRVEVDGVVGPVAQEEEAQQVGRQELGHLVRRSADSLATCSSCARPRLRNSYGMLSGGSRSKTCRLIASARSREPPAVARSLPQPSIVAPIRPQRAAQSTFQTSLARPPKR